MICVAVAAAMLLLGGDDVSVSDPIAIGQGPLRIATGERSVWVTSARDGTLSRIDSASGAGLGRAAAARARHLRCRGRRRLGLGREPAHRRGPADRRRHRHGRGADRRSAAAPAPIVFGGDRVWVADEDGGGVTAINARGGRVFKRGIAPHTAPLRLAVGAGGVWVSSADDRLGAPHRPRHRRRRRRRSVVGRGPSGITVGGGVVWVANSRSDSVTRVDPATGALLGEPIAVGAPPGRDRRRHQRRLGRQRRATTRVSRIDIESGETVGDPISVGRHPGAVAVAGDAVWVADNGDGAVTRIEP